MATVIVDRSGVFLTVEGGALVIREEGRRRSVPLHLLDRLVLQGNMTLTSGMLAALGEKGVAVVCLSARSSQRQALVLGGRHNEGAIRLGQYRWVTDPQRRGAWCRALLGAKVRRQQGNLAQWLTRRGGDQAAVRRGLMALDESQATLEQAGDDSAVLMGIEGAAARAYFAGLAAILPDGLGFAGRNRRPPKDPVNACLSLSYTLLHAEAALAAQGAGLDPLLGGLHRPAFGRESLASDLIEPLRPLADAWLVEALRDRTLRSDDFEQSGQACRLRKAGRERFYQSFEAWLPAKRRWLRRQSRQLAKALKNEASPDLAQWPEEEP